MRYDLIVVGSGPAGQKAAIAAAKQNWRVAIVERKQELLLASVYPIREVVVHATGLRGFWSYFLPMDLTMSSSATYELIEWGAAVVFGGDLGVAYVGTQGDPWDAHKDMSLAALGALLSTLAMAAVHRWRGRHQPDSTLPPPARYA